MIRRPRVTWLLDSADPSGAAVMAMRRMAVLRRRFDGMALAVSGPAHRVPTESSLHGVARLGGLAGELRMARSDVVVTTSDRTLAAAAPRLAPGTRLLHFVHTRPEIALRSDRFMRTMPRVTQVAVPPDVEPANFARQAGLPAARVVTADDFTLPEESLLGSARAAVFLAAGRLGTGSAVLDLAEAFRLALPDLADWQLRVAGWGPAFAELAEFVDRYRLTEQLLLLGARHDMPTQYLDAGVVVRVENGDANGLSVHEGLAAGIPVLGSEGVPAVRRLVRDGVNGWVLGRADPVALAGALVAAADPDRRGELAAGARAEGAGLLTADAARHLHDLFDSVLDTDLAA